MKINWKNLFYLSFIKIMLRNKNLRYYIINLLIMDKIKLSFCLTNGN